MASTIICSPPTLSALSRPSLPNNHISGHHLRMWLCPIRPPPSSWRLLLLPGASSLISERESLDTGPRSRSRRRSRSGVVNAGYTVDEDDDDDEDDDEGEDRSLDLLIRFVQNIFRKVSRRARKAVRSVLPVPISSQLVGFSVNGVIILTFMWVLKAFLEVVCTLGSVVFVSILLIRGIWTGISYLQENRNYRPDELDDEHRTWRGSQPAI